jgi:hypothetical protein
MDERDLPEGVINADPPGGWESGDASDGETAEQNQDAIGSEELADSGLASAGDGSVETDAVSQGADPDLSGDEDDR